MRSRQLEGTTGVWPIPYCVFPILLSSCPYRRFCSGSYSHAANQGTPAADLNSVHAETPVSGC